MSTDYPHWWWRPSPLLSIGSWVWVVLVNQWPSTSNGKTSSVVGITTRASRTRRMLIGLLSVVLTPLGSAIALLIAVVIWSICLIHKHLVPLTYRGNQIREWYQIPYKKFPGYFCLSNPHSSFWNLLRLWPFPVVQLCSRSKWYWRNSAGLYRLRKFGNDKEFMQSAECFLQQWKV